MGIVFHKEIGMSKYIPRRKTEIELKAITDEVVKRILENKRLRIAKVILYGSYARGDSNDYSDIDIMVLCDNRETELDDIRYSTNVISSRISLENDVDVALSLKDQKQFEQWADVIPFYQNVQNEGIVLYG